MESWDDVRILCTRYLVPCEQVDRTGPVKEALRSVGYLSGDEEELEEEEEDEYLDGEEGEDEGEDAYVKGGGDAHRLAHIVPAGLGTLVVGRSQAPAQGCPPNLGATQDPGYGYEAHDDVQQHNLSGHLHDADDDNGSSIELEPEHREDVHEHHEVQLPVYQHTGPQTNTGVPGQLASQAS